MIHKIILLVAMVTIFPIASRAQFCGTDMATGELLKEHPELASKIEHNKELMEAQIANILKNANLNKLAKTTSAFGTDSFIIPVVVHVIHNYGSEDVTDAAINTMIANLNVYYNARNTDLPNVITPFKQYIGNMHIGFHLATLNPAGQPTRGITRRVSYLTNGGDNYAKFDLWDPSDYLNIWIESVIGLGADNPGSVVAAYSQLPDVAGADPFIDGLITAAPFIAGQSYAFIISHEVGHYLGLLHPFGSNNTGCAAAGCGDDGVDDTPPTTGEFCVSCAVGLYDTMCATGYLKKYPSVLHPGTDSVWDYPDTANTQNIMTYSQCDPELMFTKGQAARVYGVLQATLANRDSLSTPFNLANTGALEPLPVLPPIVDFNVSSHFVCQNAGSVTFTNFTWNDSVQSVLWTLPSYASTSTSSSTTNFTSTFSQPGWVNISLVANGKNGSGSDTLVRDNTLFVADNNAINASGYVEEFDPSANNNDVGKYPMFNYFNNEFKWILNNNTGYYDNSCVQYVGYDARTFPANSVGIPKGDYDDMFTPVFDLTSLSGGAHTPSLNFMYSAASITSTAGDVNDTLEIDYNSNCSNLWVPLAYLSKGQLVNYGSYPDPYRPLWQGAWSLQSIPLAQNAITSHTIFRFRYKPGTNLAYYTHTNSPLGYYSTGNNFYMDRLNFSNYQLGLNTLMPSDKSIIVAPNPTNSDAFVMIATKNDVNAQIQVTDIAGRVVYTMAQQTSGPLTRIMIPQSAIATTGMYLVHVVAGDQVQTEKLVVY